MTKNAPDVTDVADAPNGGSLQGVVRRLRVPKWARNAAKEYVSRLWPKSARRFKKEQKQLMSEIIANHHASAMRKPPNDQAH